MKGMAQKRKLLLSDSLRKERDQKCILNLIDPLSVSELLTHIPP